MGIPTERRRAAEQRGRLVLAIPDVADAVAAIENSGVHGVLKRLTDADESAESAVDLDFAALRERQIEAVRYVDTVFASLFDASGLRYTELLERLLELAVERHETERRFRH